MYFEKVSLDEWRRALQGMDENVSEEEVTASYDQIILPKTSTQSAAGHDFYLPFACYEFFAENKELIPTGIRWVTETPEEQNLVLLICPRSGLGTKYGMRLSNTIGVIDADYCLAANEGHIMASIECSREFVLRHGDRFMQGIIIPFYKCGEVSETTRTGGFGSTGV